jgi:hypothetical protein
LTVNHAIPLGVRLRLNAAHSGKVRMLCGVEPSGRTAARPGFEPSP